MVAKFLEVRAEHLIRLNQIVHHNGEAFKKRFIELLDNPSLRDNQIIIDHIGYMGERYLVETGDESAMVGYIEDMISFTLQPWSDIMEVPLPSRGDIHSSGAALTAEICRIQTLMELVTLEALTIGDVVGNENKKYAKSMTTKQKISMAKTGGEDTLEETAN